MVVGEGKRELLIASVVNQQNIVFQFNKDSVVEEAIIFICQNLKITTVTRHLFGLRYKNNWLALNLRLWDVEIGTAEFRLRFKVPNIDKLRKLDISAFNYYYQQVRTDVLQNNVQGIEFDKHRKELIGLGVTDMYRDILENGFTQQQVSCNYKRYIPKEVVRNHLFFLKKPMDETLSAIVKRGVVDLPYIKSGYLEGFDAIAPDYLIEDHKAVIIESDATRAIIVKVNPFNEEKSGILYKFVDKKVWNHVSAIEDLCFISLRTDWSIEISRKTGIPLYIGFRSFNAAISFISLVDGYYRLSVKWTFNLCKDLMTPSLQKLKKMKCHGPVGGEFSYAKLEEKRNNKLGCYIIRESETCYDTYYIDVCIKDNFGTIKPVTYKINKKMDEAVWFSADQNVYDSLSALIEHFSSSDNTNQPKLTECIPSSEYEESNLLLCKPVNKNHYVQGVTEELGPSMPYCIHPRDLQIFRGKTINGSNGFTMLHKCLWKKNKKIKVEVALKVLKNIHHESHVKEFLKLASDWGLLQSSSFVNLIGVTLSDPIAMVTEYFSLGSLDKYLSLHKSTIQDVDLVEAASYLANALWLLEEAGLVHGNVRCEKLIVASHTKDAFIVKLSDPGLYEAFSDFDYHWIPPELFSSPELVRKSPQGDIWAFGTTLWEIFSYGAKPSNSIIADCPDKTSIFQFYCSGNRLSWPKGCPKEIYSLMLECWLADPVLRKKPQAAKRDINQHLYQVFNSRMHHSYATIAPARKSTSSDTLNDVSSEGLDNSSIHSLSTQLSILSIFDETYNQTSSDSQLEFFLQGGTINNQMYDNFGFSTDMSAVFTNMDFLTTTTSLGGPSSLQSVFEYNRDLNVVLQGKIGQGFYGEVYQGLIEDVTTDRSSEPEKVAIKRLRIMDDASWIADFEREIEIMKKLKHPNIVEMKGVILEPEVNLFMEYVEHGSLKCYLNINKDRLCPRRHILKYALDVAKGMEYLGKMKIVHRDLAARNVLVADEFTVKISDFGLAQFMGSSNYYISQSNRELPVKWFAPESLRYGKFSVQSDVWSYGVTLYEMFTFGGEPVIEPIQDSSSLLDTLDSGIRLPKPEACSAEVYATLMAPCWMKEAKERPSFSMIISIVEELLQNKSN